MYIEVSDCIWLDVNVLSIRKKNIRSSWKIASHRLKESMNWINHNWYDELIIIKKYRINVSIFKVIDDIKFSLNKKKIFYCSCITIEQNSIQKNSNTDLQILHSKYWSKILFKINIFSLKKKNHFDLIVWPNFIEMICVAQSQSWFACDVNKIS